MSDTPSEGVLSVDQAAGLLGEPEDNQPEAERDATEEEVGSSEGVEAEAEEAPEPEEVAEEPEPEPEEEAPQAPAEPVVEPPYHWNGEHKAKFAELPAELQQLVAEQERGRDVAIRTAQQKFAEASKAALAEAEGVKALTQKLATVADEAEQSFQRVIPEIGMAWKDVDWAAWFQQDPQTAAMFKARHDYEHGEMQRIKSARQEAETTAERASFQTYVAEQAAELQRIAPELASDGSKRQALGQYLSSIGYTSDELKGIGARDMVIAHKAMLWDAAQARTNGATGAARPAQTAPKKPAPQPAQTRPVRPAPAATAPSPKRVVDQAADKFARKRGIDDAVALLTARGSR